MFNFDVNLYYETLEQRGWFEKHSLPMGMEYRAKFPNCKGSVQRLFIEEGIEISLFKELTYQEQKIVHRQAKSNLLEICFVQKGLGKVEIPELETYTFYERSLSFYQFKNSFSVYQSKMKDMTGISIYMNFDVFSKNQSFFDREGFEVAKLFSYYFQKSPIYICESNFQQMQLLQEIMSLDLSSFAKYIQLKAKVLTIVDLALETIFHISEVLKEEEIKKMEEIKGILMQDFSIWFDLETISQKIKISPYKIQRGFKSLYGKTFYQYYKLLKLEHAKKVLKERPIKISDLSNDLGYENPSKFSNAFKKYTGKTPSVYQKE